jgi:hypothetical protein
MKLLGHTSPEMTMRYVDVALTDLQREFQRARSQPRHLSEESFHLPGAKPQHCWTPPSLGTSTDNSRKPRPKK